MSGFKALGGFKPGTILLAALSLSIGWGIRGNFGHEYGAMIPGALTAIAVCLLSGREDWQNRVVYFGMFGALGWAFGGSMSYMQVVAYTHSGQLASQHFGFFGLFFIGFLWAAMGGAGTAFPAVVDKERLTAIFRPLCWIFVGWVIFNKFLLLYFETLFPANYDSTWSRQAAYTYWFDADWMETTAALVSLLAFELWDNRRTHFVGGRIVALPFLIVGLAITGWAIQGTMQMTGVDRPIAAALIQYQVSQEYVVASAEKLLTEADADQLALADGAILTPTAEPALAVASEEALALQLDDAPYNAAQRAWAVNTVLSDQLINWPNVVLFFPQYIGLFVGALTGLAIYFFLFGRFGSGSSLFLSMGLGWFGGFLLFPVLLGHPFYDGDIWFRMTPPRGDNWAGILGVVIATALWLLRNNYVPVLYAMLVSGIIGGLGFSGGQLVKLVGLRPGNANVTQDPAIVEQWAHWNSANWHSILEQTYGFFNGIGIAVAMALLAARVGKNNGAPIGHRWTKVFAAAFVLFGVTYLNMFKNVLEWRKQDLFPDMMAMPLLSGIVWSAEVWFNIIFGLAALAGIVLLVCHTRRPIALVPTSAIGRGQMLYVAFLATVVVMNFERAIGGFADGRLITEGMIFINATIALVLILVLPTPGKAVPKVGLVDYGPALYRTLCLGLGALLIATFGMTWAARGLYGSDHSGHAGEQFRFGDSATWKIKPTEKSKKHS